MNGDTNSNAVPSGVQGACPSGWHLPGKSELEIMINYIGGPYQNGNKLKSTDTTYWNNPNPGVTNSSGFSALPGGHNVNGSFYGIGQFADFWTSTQYDNTNSWYMSLFNLSPNINITYNNKDSGFSIRCIKD